jgi:hypothetical protein
MLPAGQRRRSCRCGLDQYKQPKLDVGIQVELLGKQWSPVPLSGSTGNNFGATPDDNPPGQTRLEQLLNTAKINIPRLHDMKHGKKYRNWNVGNILVARVCDPDVDSRDADCLANQTPV